MTGKKSEWSIEYYTDSRGRSDVLEYINGLPKTEQAQIARSLLLLREFGPTGQHPHAKRLTGYSPLWELRPGSNRLIYFVHTGQRFVMLVAFRKKSNRTPRKHLDRAMRRLVELEERER